MIAGIVCEYNPFHNGHLYHIDETRKAGADKIVCVMSGNFVQRGDCALIDKHKRAEAAVRCGVNLVIDLFVPWAMASAESFAEGGISLLSGIGIDILSFGSETDDKAVLLRCAEASEDERVSRLTKRRVSEGVSYPAALSQAVREIYGEETGKILACPNSTLAVEYIKQLNKYMPDCDLLPIKRKSVDHDSDMISGGYASASKIRELSLSEDISDLVPDFVNDMMSREKADGGFHKTQYGERAILSALREMKKEEFGLYVTDTRGLADRIYNCVRDSVGLEDVISAVKTKSYTLARVKREVMNAYLKIPTEYCKKTPPYIRVLAADGKGFSLLKNAKLPIVTKHSDAVFEDSFSKEIYDLQCSSTDKYELMREKIGVTGAEQRSSVLIIK